MYPIRFLALSALFYVTLLTVFGDNNPHPAATSTTQAASVVLYTPHTAPKTTTTTTSSLPPVSTAHEALQADLSDPEALPVISVDPDTPCYGWLTLAVEQGWPDDPTTLTTLGERIYAESRCQSGAINPGTGDSGLLQINPPTHRAWVEDIFGEPFEVAMSDPAKNLRFAWMLYSSREQNGQCGWKPWGIPCP